jgi:hypothetical protein
MSKYGKIEINVAEYYSSNALQAFADKVGISYDKAESLARERIYRKLYTKKRNQDPAVQEQRKQLAHKRHQLLKMLG